MIRRSSLILLEVAVGLFAVVAIAFVFAWWRLSAAPIELASLEAHVEQQLADARGGRAVDIDRVELSWSAQARGLQLKALGVRALDGEGKVLSKSREVALGIDVRQLPLGRVAIDSMRFSGGEATITLAAGGGAALAFGPPGSSPDFIFPPASPDLSITERVNRALDSMAAALKPLGPGGHLRLIEVEGVRLIVIDEADGGSWTAEGARFGLVRDRKALRMSAQARLESPQGPAPVEVAVTTDTGFQAAAVEIRLNDARLQALIPTERLGLLAGLDAPMRAAVSAALDRKSGVTRIEGDLAVGRGEWTTPGGATKLDGGRVRGAYDFVSDALVIEEIALAGSRTRVTGLGRLESASALFSDSDAPAALDVAFQSLALDMPGVFAGPAELRDVSLKGKIDRANNKLTVDAFRFGVEAAKAEISGEIYWAEDRQKVLRPAARLTGGFTGELSPAAVLRLWPIEAGKGARDWLSLGLKGGVLRNVAMRADIRPDMIARGQLPDEALDITFDYSDASVLYIEGMAQIVGGRGKARLRGNSFELDLVEGRVGELAVSQGKVILPRLNPKGALATFSGRATGEAKEMVALLLSSPLELADALPADPASIVGRGHVDFAIQRPMLSEVPEEDYRFAIEAQLEEAGGVSKDQKVAISNWRAHIKGDERGLTFAGPLDLAGAPGEIVWREALEGEEATRSTFTYSGRIGSAVMEKLGYPVELFAKGPIGVEVCGIGRGLEVAKADLTLDLAAARVYLPAFPIGFWSKPPGQGAASVRLEAVRRRDAGYDLNAVRARAPGLVIDADLSLAADGALMAAKIARVDIADRAQGRGQIIRTADGVLAISASGAYLNIAPMMNGAAEASPSAARLDDQSPLRAEINVARLELQGKAAIAEAKLSYATNGKSLIQASLLGADPGGRPVRMAITPGAAGGKSAITFSAEDAGFAWLAVTGVENVRGGAATAQGLWTPGLPSTADVKLAIKDFRLVNMPVMARLLSSVGSLQGMADMLAGEGIAFATLEAPITFANGRLNLGECRMSGPSLGLTANGRVDLATGAMQIDGVLVPSYGLNSMLGHVPLVGELLTSRKGEGVVGMTYSIKGPADNAKVGVNPLSALTPGILRRIFEPFRPASAGPKEAANAPPPTSSPQ